MTQVERSEAVKLGQSVLDALGQAHKHEVSGLSQRAQDYYDDAFNSAAALLALLEKEAGGEGEWRPIESAPKDGTEVLVSDGIRVFEAWWSEAADDDGCLHKGWWLAREMELWPDHELAHWMPLPPAPPAREGPE